MPRKIQAPIEFRIRALSVPRSMAPDRYLRSLLDGIRQGELPRGVKVELYWRNPDTKIGRSKDWQSDDFLTALAESNGGFASALSNVIRRKLEGGQQAPAPERMVVRKKKKSRKVKRGRIQKKPQTRTAAKRRRAVSGRTTRKVAHVSRKPAKLRKPASKSKKTGLRTTPKVERRIPPTPKKRKTVRSKKRK